MFKFHHICKNRNNCVAMRLDRYDLGTKIFQFISNIRKIPIYSGISLHFKPFGGVRLKNDSYEILYEFPYFHDQN